jgi:beta-lactamase regulating signal transducer with metallopeptidase domain/5-hydroxyisourate hydrolase-like protein (transthyretin family)
MNAWTFENSKEALVVLGGSVLVQWSIVMAMALTIAACLRRYPAVRYWVLCVGLLMTLAAPFIAGAAQWTGTGLLPVSLVSNAAPMSDNISPPTKVGGANDATAVAREPRITGNEPRVSKPQSVSESNAPARNSMIAESEAASAASVVGESFINRGRSVGLFVVGIWLVGSLIFSLKLVFGWRRVAGIARSARPNSNEILAAAFRSVPNSSRTELAISDQVSGPIAVGLWRKRIVLPASLVDRLTPDQARAILQHEVAHIVRHDQIIVLLQNIAGALCWIHPMTSVLNRQLAQAREEVCDNFVLADMDAPSYSRTLLALAEHIQAVRPLPASVGFFTATWTLESRIAGLLDEGRSRRTRLAFGSKIFVAALSVVFAAAALFGTVQLTVGQSPGAGNAQVAEKAAENGGKAILIRGRIVNEQEKPVAGAFVAAISRVADLNDKRTTLAEVITDENGRYELKLAEVASRTHMGITVIARAERTGFAWQGVDLGPAEAKVDLTLRPEQLLHVRLVDRQNKPAANVAIESYSIAPAQGKGDDARYLSLADVEPRPRSFPAQLVTDQDGLVIVPGVPSDHGVHFTVAGSDQWARQQIAMNLGWPEARPEQDATYRGTVKNVPAGQIATIPLAPATIFEGVVLLGDTGKPAANSRIDIWASEQEEGGSRISSEGKTDASGRFRLNPYAGVRFGINAYPPPGTPYLARRGGEMKWEPGERPKKIEIRLPTAVVANGRVVDAISGMPIARASVQYHLDLENNKSVPDSALTGWQDIHLTDDQGWFNIAVPPGPGTLLVHAPAQSNYILKEMGSRQIEIGKPGGKRYYAHAFERIDPPSPNAKVTGSNTFAVKTLKLQPGGKADVKLVDADGKTVEKAIAMSRLNISKYSPNWIGFSDEVSGGRIEIRGLEKGKRYPVYFLEPKRRLGATALISTDNPQTTVTLKPCATAKVRILQHDGKPQQGGIWGPLMVMTPGPAGFDKANPDQLIADQDYVENIDRSNFAGDHFPDKNGVLVTPPLIPGATYRFTDIDAKGHGLVTVKEFVAESGKMHDLGEIVLKKYDGR